jgi:hypothetical protein
MGCCIVGTDADRPGIVVDSFIEPSLFLRRHAQVFVCLGVTRLKPEHFGIVENGRIKFSLSFQCHSQVIMHVSPPEADKHFEETDIYPSSDGNRHWASDAFLR